MLRHGPGWVVFGLTVFLWVGCGRQGEAPAVSGVGDAAPVTDADVPTIGNPHARYCPVDGEPVALAEALTHATLRVDHEEHVYVFCGASCRETFVGDPERYIRDPAAPRLDTSLAADE